MRRLFPFVLPLALPLLLSAPRAQEPEPKREKTFQDDGAPTTSEQTTAKWQKQVEGAWQLVGFKDATGEFLSKDVVGYALFVDGYMAMEAHYTGTLSGFEEDFFQTGFHKYRFDLAGDLHLESVIGTDSFTPDEIPLFEFPGTLRTFRAVLAQQMLTLISEGQSRFSFRRLAKHDPARLDFFGRTIPADKQE